MKSTVLADLEDGRKSSTMDDVYVRAARSLLRWDQARLALEAGVNVLTVRRYETGTATVSADTVARFVAVLEEAGVMFLPANTVRGCKVEGGVALKPVNKAADRLVYNTKRKQSSVDDA